MAWEGKEVLKKLAALLQGGCNESLHLLFRQDTSAKRAILVLCLNVKINWHPGTIV